MGTQTQPRPWHSISRLTNPPGPHTCLCTRQCTHAGHHQSKNCGEGSWGSAGSQSRAAPRAQHMDWIHAQIPPSGHPIWGHEKQEGTGLGTPFICTEIHQHHAVPGKHLWITFLSWGYWVSLAMSVDSSQVGCAISPQTQAPSSIKQHFMLPPILYTVQTSLSFPAPWAFSYHVM